jgi:hypothetical protein
MIYVISCREVKYESAVGRANAQSVNLEGRVAAMTWEQVAKSRLQRRPIFWRSGASTMSKRQRASTAELPPQPVDADSIRSVQ